MAERAIWKLSKLLCSPPKPEDISCFRPAHFDASETFDAHHHGFFSATYQQKITRTVAVDLKPFASALAKSANDAAAAPAAEVLIYAADPRLRSARGKTAQSATLPPELQYGMQDVLSTNRSLSVFHRS